MFHCHCQLIPDEVLERLSCDPMLSHEIQAAAAYSVQLSQHLRGVRLQNLRLTGFLMENHHPVKLADTPEVAIFDCMQTESLPGKQIKEPATSEDISAQRTYSETRQMANFMREVFQRNSIDDAGMTLMSSVHYGRKYNNAMWNGQQMIYGDGDGELFLDFTLGVDVIAHELAHGITQYTLQLEYEEESGGLNESLSDCFGAMFRQWRRKQQATCADWLIGADIIGPATRERGYTCLRDMSDPGGKHCLAPQPASHGELAPGQDPHKTSGPPNLAFCSAAKQVGGFSWDSIGRVWYRVITTAGMVPNMNMTQFAEKTRQAAVELYGRGSVVDAAVDAGWKKVGL